jgi:toxin CptA
MGRSRHAERLLLVLWMIGVCGVTVACIEADGIDWRQGLLAISAVVAGMAAWTGVLRCAALCELGFDGQLWSVTGTFSYRSAKASVALDLQSLLLICLKEPHRSRGWVWVERQAKPEAWRDLRRALYSRPPSAALAAGKSSSDVADVHHSSS